MKYVSRVPRPPSDGLIVNLGAPLPLAQAISTRRTSSTEFRAFNGLTPTRYIEVGRRFRANILAARGTAGR